MGNGSFDCGFGSVVLLQDRLKTVIKKIESKKGIENIGPSVEAMADAEGLDAHKSAVIIRLKNLGV